MAEELFAQVFQSMKRTFRCEQHEATQNEEGAPMCAICFVEFKDREEVVELKCDANHFFHEECLM